MKNKIPKKQPEEQPQNENLLSQIMEELQLLDADLRAEVVVAALKNTATPLSQGLTVYPQGTFTRNYDYDIMQMYAEVADNNKMSLCMDISRNGIYDILPEAIFHKLETEKQVEYSSYRKQLKLEAQEARKLFLSIDNELFTQRVKLEEKERAALINFSSLKDTFLLEFWGIDPKLPLSFARKLLKLLPHLDKITTNLALAIKCLSNCIDTHVEFKKKFSVREIKQPINNSMQLGLDFVLRQKKLRISQPELHITIVAENTKKAALFLKGDLKKFITIFYNYFIPVEFDIKTRISVANSEKFLLSKKDGALMGISTIL